MNCLECLDETSDEELRLRGSKLPDPRVVVPKVATLHQIHDKVQSCLIVERILHVDDEVGVDATH